MRWAEAPYRRLFNCHYTFLFDRTLSDLKEGWGDGVVSFFLLWFHIFLFDKTLSDFEDRWGDVVVSLFLLWFHIFLFDKTLSDYEEKWGDVAACSKTSAATCFLCAFHSFNKQLSLYKV